jgi:ribosome biogenesis GTPase / thiamine phosphate phosphatase
LLDATLQDLGWDDAWASSLEALNDDNLIPGRVAAQHRGEYVVWTEAREVRAKGSGRLRYERSVGGDLPTVGDWVAARPHEGGERATVEAVLPRRSAFRRKGAGFDSVDQVLAANVDVAFLLTALDDDFSPRRIERYITTAWESGAQPVVVLTKSDLCADVADALITTQAVAVGAAVCAISNVTGDGLELLSSHLSPARTAVLLGSSGVGKSTLLNSLAGTELMRTAALAADGTGRHTTTHRELLILPSRALVIDTPGLRELQLYEGDVEASFQDVQALAADCRFRDCAHAREPGCAVLAAVDAGRLELDRLRSWRKLQRELEAIAARTDRRLRLERKRRWKQRTRSVRKPRW